MQGEKINGSNRHVEASSETDEILDSKKQAIGQMVVSQSERKDAPLDFTAEVAYWSGEYNDAERQFAKYSASLGDNQRKTDAYQQTLLRYEDDIAYDWQRMEDYTNKAMSAQLLRSPYETAATQSLGSVEPHETVEAAVGIFYEERVEALREQLMQADETEEVAAEREILRRTWRKVLDYNEATRDYDLLHSDYNGYHRVRRDCHNRMIRQLNTLNLLAEKYGTKRFTPRNFMTNDFLYESVRDPGGKLNHRVDYDRESVLAYFETVFKKDIELVNKKSIRANRDSLAGFRSYNQPK